MPRRLVILAMLATPLLGVISWWYAYRAAVAVTPGRVCCENGMDSLPIAVYFFGIPGLVLASALGFAGIQSSESPRARLTLVAAATGVTVLTVVYMFVLPPLTLTADKTSLGDYWPVTPGTLVPLVIGSVLTLLPWLVALGVNLIEYRARGGVSATLTTE